jgi:hypothetical protein
METFSNEQEEIFVGSMLGDGSINKTSKETYNSHYAVLRKTTDIEYLEWHAKKFNNFCKPDPIRHRSTFDQRTNKTYYASRFRTKSTKLFTNQRLIWYKDAKKIVPNNIQLSPLSIAIWFCDDGNISINNKQLLLGFATDSFSEQEVHYLKNLLEASIDYKLIVNKHEKGFIIRGSTGASLALAHTIKNFMPKGMDRKLSKYNDWLIR